MRGVAGVGRGGAVSPRGKTRSAASGFSLDGLGSGSAAAETAAASATAAVGLSLLAVQENGGRTGRDAAARRRAASILDELQGLQAELLGGRTDPARLARLAALQDGEEGTDPALREAVRAIALRARIELARRGRHPETDRSATVA
ncbi:MAG TPA: flagellar assembly protein FliX [Acetobacteraceae bacterium]|nr:flagellar assembly protein FliX [Acetobacteraceae bacterium]